MPGRQPDRDEVHPHRDGAQHSHRLVVGVGRLHHARSSRASASTCGLRPELSTRPSSRDSAVASGRPVPGSFGRNRILQATLRVIAVGSQADLALVAHERRSRCHVVPVEGRRFIGDHSFGDARARKPHHALGAAAIGLRGAFDGAADTLRLQATRAGSRAL